MGDQNEASVSRMYLQEDYWSPRYENTFYSFKLNAFELLPAMPKQSVVIGKTNLPAYYYKIDVFCAHEERTVYRRYSQFKWLYKQLPPAPESLIIPPGSCFLCLTQNDEFAKNRMEQLREFLNDALRRPDIASHPAVVAFLELDKIGC